MKLAVGLLIGFGLGVAVGLLLAPQSGEATRSQLGEQGLMLRDRSFGMSDELRTRANDALGQGREMYVRTKDDLSDRYSRAKSGDL
ncbi:MAG: YtxH domain-containing protein [Ktedonobacteraceae bacterium]|nr:YtxH domain-containing protein [Chloroflexota bacterium]